MDKIAVCPVCNSTNVTELYKNDSDAVARHLLNAEKSAFKEQCCQKVEKIWNAKYAAFYHCRSCTFEFAYPFIAADADFYSFVYNAENNYPVDKWEYTVTLKSINLLCRNEDFEPRLLELGAGNGSFLKIVAASGIPIQKIFATEFSETGAGSIAKMGIACFHKDLQLISEMDLHGKVSIVCMFQVLEHLAEIHELFDKLNELTIPGSRMYISVPNNLHRSFFDRFGYHYDLPPVHVGRYNFRCMSRLCEPHGWKLLQHLIQPTAYKERILKFIFSEYTRKQQLYNPEKVRIRFLRLALRYGLLILIMLFHVRIMAGLRKSDLGTSQWFELERINIT